MPRNETKIAPQCPQAKHNINQSINFEEKIKSKIVIIIKYANNKIKIPIIVAIYEKY